MFCSFYCKELAGFQNLIDINMYKVLICVAFVSETFARYGSSKTNVWQKILTPSTWEFSCKVVHEKLWKSSATFKPKIAGGRFPFSFLSLTHPPLSLPSPSRFPSLPLSLSSLSLPFKAGAHRCHPGKFLKFTLLQFRFSTRYVKLVFFINGFYRQ